MLKTISPIDNTIYVYKLDESSKWEKFDNNPVDGVIWIQIHDNYIYAIKTDNTVSKHQIFNELPDPVLGPGKWSSPLPNFRSAFLKSDKK